jgi:hypothetical protein
MGKSLWHWVCHICIYQGNNFSPISSNNSSSEYQSVAGLFCERTVDRSSEGIWILWYTSRFFSEFCNTRLCFWKAKHAAVQIWRLCNQLHFVNFSGSRTYFFSFVNSQFHGFQIVTFLQEYYEQVPMLFYCTHCSLRIGYPRAICYWFVGAVEFQAQQIIGCLRFF